MSLPQPLACYRVLSGNDPLHFGYWAEDSDASLAEAQTALSRLWLARLPDRPLRILLLGARLGAMAGQLAGHGHQVTALAPSAELVAYAQAHYPGPVYLAGDFNALLFDGPPYDLILIDEYLQFLPDLPGAFNRLARLLDAGHGRVLMWDQVSYLAETRASSAVHLVENIEAAFAAQGFYVTWQQRIGPQVTRTCEWATEAFDRQQSLLLECFGQDKAAEIEAYAQAMRRQAAWYQTGAFGYEMWELRPSPYLVRGDGDPAVILAAFTQTFGAARSLAHWRWKFSDSPFGGPFLSTAWHGETLAAHYSGYAVPIWGQGQESLTYQVGDTFTVPAYRNVGRGPTSLLTRAFRHFERQYCERRIPFGYGFNTAKIQRFGQMFLGYQPVAQVFERILHGQALLDLRDRPLSGEYRLLRTREAGEWADRIYPGARQAYGWLNARHRVYLDWRYTRHPDFRYEFFLVLRNGEPVGWWLGRQENPHVWWLGDALFLPDGAEAAAAFGFAASLRALREQGQDILQLRGWFARTPIWWNAILDQLGFETHRQFQNLDLVVKTYAPGLDAHTVGEQFYFTMGDSDLF